MTRRSIFLPNDSFNDVMDALNRANSPEKNVDTSLQRGCVPMAGREKKKKPSESALKLAALSSEAIERNRQQWKRLLQTDIKLACLLVRLDMQFVTKEKSERFYLTNLNRIKWNDADK